MTVNINELTYLTEDPWMEEWASKMGRTFDKHIMYLALKGKRDGLVDWCNSRPDIWITDRLGLLFNVYMSLVMYGQLEPIIIDQNKRVVTGHKRVCCLLAMGQTTVEAEYTK